MRMINIVDLPDEVLEQMQNNIMRINHLFKEQRIPVVYMTIQTLLMDFLMHCKPQEREEMLEEMYQCFLRTIRENDNEA
jgi:hypothetical protein